MKRMPKKNAELTREMYRSKTLVNFCKEEPSVKRRQPSASADPWQKQDIPMTKDISRTKDVPAGALGIADISQTAESYENGGVNVLTIRKTDGTTTEFKVRNGYGGGGGGGRGTARPLTVKAIRKAIKADTKNVISGYAYPIVGYGVDPSEKKSYTKFKIAADEEFWKQEQSLVGESVSVVLDYWRPRLGAIISIDREGQNGVATVTVDTYWVESHYQNDSVDEDGWYVLREGEGVNNWFMLSDHRNMGTVDTTAGALALGDYNEVTQTFAMAVGANNRAHGKADFVSGQNNVSVGYCCFVGGMGNRAEGEESTVFGSENINEQDQGHVIGAGNKLRAPGKVSSVEGYGNTVIGTTVHVEGQSHNVAGTNNHIEGNKHKVEGGSNNHVEGTMNTLGADVRFCHVEGGSENTVLDGSEGCHVEGYYRNSAKGNGAHAEGHDRTYAEGNGAHAEGSFTSAKGVGAHSGGRNSQAHARCAFAHGQGIKAQYDYQTAFGKYNKNKANNLLEIGGGTSDTDRLNVLEVDKDGRGYLIGRHIVVADEWITIADTTLTEDVASLEFTTDINGNPFECKRVIFWCYKPNGLQNTESWLLWFPTVETSSQLGKGYRGNYYVPKNSYGFLLDSTIVKENELIHHWAMGYSAGNLGTPQEILKYATDATYFTKYGIYPQQHMSQFYSFVKGTKIKVWGLKT